MNKKKNRNWVAVVIIFMFMGAIVAAAIFLPQYLSVSRVVKTDIPLIQTKIYSEKDEKSYQVQTLFTVEMDTETRRSVSNKLLFEELTKIVESMDIHELESADGVDYINRYATTELNKRLSSLTDTETNVFAYDLYIGNRFQLDDPSDQRNEFYDAMSNSGRN